VISNLQISKVFAISVVLLLLLSVTPALSESKNKEIIVPKSTNAVLLDGIWSYKNEWTDSSEIKLTQNGLTAYLRIKHDSSFFYVLIDFVSDKTLVTGNWGVVCFDTKGDSAKVLDRDDYCFYKTIRGAGIKAGEQFVSGIMQRNGTKWSAVEQGIFIPEFGARMAFSQISDPYDSNGNISTPLNHLSTSYRFEQLSDRYVSKEHHVSYEFKIPIRSEGFIKWHLEEKMKFYVYVNDGWYNKFVEWPANAGGKRFTIDSPTLKEVLASPDSWGNMYLKP